MLVCPATSPSSRTACLLFLVLGLWSIGHVRSELVMDTVTHSEEIDMGFNVYFIDASDVTIAVLLPDVSTVGNGRLVWLKRIDQTPSNLVILISEADQLFDGPTYYQMQPLDSVGLVTNEGQLHILSELHV